MGKPKKRAKKFLYDVNRKKAWKKKKQLPKVHNALMQEAWDDKKSLLDNLKEMGIAADANKAVPIPRPKDMDIPELERSKKKSKTAQKQAKEFVVEEFEKEAALPERKREEMSEPDQLFCIHLIEKYGDNYKAMGMDKQNHYQDTPKQIKRKILRFKSIPAYERYLNSKQQKMETT